MASTDLERVIADTGKDVAGSLQDLANQSNLVTAALRRRVAGVEKRVGQTAPSVTGSRASGAALVSLLTALAGIGLISDDTTT